MSLHDTSRCEICGSSKKVRKVHGAIRPTVVYECPNFDKEMKKMIKSDI